VRYGAKRLDEAWRGLAKPRVKPDKIHSTSNILAKYLFPAGRAIAVFGCNVSSKQPPAVSRC